MLHFITAIFTRICYYIYALLSLSLSSDLPTLRDPSISPPTLLPVRMGPRDTSVNQKQTIKSCPHLACDEGYLMSLPDDHCASLMSSLSLAAATKLGLAGLTLRAATREIPETNTTKRNRHCSGTTQLSLDKTELVAFSEAFAPSPVRLRFASSPSLAPERSSSAGG